MIASKSGKLIHMVATLSGKSGKSEKQKKMTKVRKSQEKMGVFEKVMKSQEIWYKNAVKKKVYHH